MQHPRRHEGAAAGDEAAVPTLVLQPLHGLQIDAGVNGHEVRAELRLLRGDPEEIVGVHEDNAALVPGRLDEGLVQGHRTDRERGVLDDATPDSRKSPPVETSIRVSAPAFSAILTSRPSWSTPTFTVRGCRWKR